MFIVAVSLVLFDEHYFVLYSFLFIEPWTQCVLHCSRVDWSSSEDSLLLVCKVASCYLLPSSPRPRMLPCTLVRNILHKSFTESQNKTGRACQRRINYVMKDPRTAESVAIFVEEVRQDSYIKEHFKPPNITQNRENLESVYGCIFIELVDHLVNKFSSNSSRNNLQLPDSMEKLLEMYEVIPAKSIKPKRTYPEPKSIKDIHFYVIQTLIYSSLCCRADRESYAYQLYQAYRQYPQQLLYDALLELRSSQMISYKKCYNRSGNSQTCLPLSASPFQLSMSYIHKFVTKYQYDVYHNCWSLLKKLKASYLSAYSSGKTPEDLVQNSDLAVPLMRNKNNEGGCIAALIEQTSMKRVIMHTFLPETIIIIDTNRTITSQLPYQSNSLTRRVNDLAAACGQKIDISGVPSYDQTDNGLSDHESLNSKSKSEATHKRSLEHEKETATPDRKKRRLSVIPEHGSSYSVTQDKEAVEHTHYSGDSNVNEQTFDDSFDLNDVTLDGCPDSSSFEKKVVEHQSEYQGSKRRSSSSNPTITISSGKRLKTSESVESFCEDSNNTIDSLPKESCQPENTDSDMREDTDTEADNADTSRTSESSGIVKCNSRSKQITSASRLSVFMKDQNTISLLENQESGGGGPALLQHMQDNLLLTACDVTCQLTVPRSAAIPPPPEDGNNTEGLKMLQECLLPVDKKQQTDILQRFKR